MTCCCFVQRLVIAIHLAAGGSVLFAQATNVADNNSLTVTNQTIEDANQSSETSRKSRGKAAVGIWRKIKVGMQEDQVRSMLGEPKLIQGGSHECVWFYQDIPTTNATPNFGYQGAASQVNINRYNEVTDKRSVSDVGGIRTGYILFEARSVNELMVQERERYNDAIRKTLKAYRINETPSMPNINGGAPMAGTKRNPQGGVPGVVSSPVIELSSEASSYSIPKPNKTYPSDVRGGVDKANDELRYRQSGAQFESTLKKIRKNYDDRARGLTGVGAPRKPQMRVSFVSQPDWNNTDSMDAKPLKGNPTEGVKRDKWQFPQNWHTLELNLTEEKVYAKLGEPLATKQSTEGSTAFYGSVPDHGVVQFTTRQDSEPRLSSWTEPFWPIVYKELRGDANDIP